MKSKTFKLLISVILLVATLSPVVHAPYDTASPSESSDDAMMTTLGNYFGDTHFLALQDETVDMVTGIRFNGVDVPQGAKINNATLFVYNVYDHGVGIASCTLAGDDADNSRAFNDSSSFSRVYTLEFVIWNTSDIRSTGLHNVSITEIVQEIVDRPGWSSGNSLSLVIFSESGSPRREFTSEDSFYTTPYIAIWHDEEPPADEIDDIQDQAETPYNDTDVYDWEYNDTYRGIDIYIASQVGNASILLTTSDFLEFFNTTKGNPNYVDWAGAEVFDHQEAGASEFIASMDGWTFLQGQNGTDLYLFYSDDEFITWNTVNVNTELGGILGGHDSNFGSLWPDQTGDSLIHLVYSSDTDDSGGTYEIIYTNFTLDPLTENLVFNGFESVTTNAGFDQIEPDLYQQRNGTIHFAWQGRNGTVNQVIQYRRKQENGAYLDPIRIQGDAATSGVSPDIVANEETGIALVAWHETVGPPNQIKWDIVFPNNTQGTVTPGSDRALANARYVSMVNDRRTGNNTAHLAYVDHNGDHIEYRSRTIDNTTAWTLSQVISGLTDRMFYPTIAYDEKNDTLAGVWWNLDGADTDWNIWQRTDAPNMGSIRLLDRAFHYPSMEDYYSRIILGTSIWLVYPNGTLVDTAPLPDGVDPEDAIDDLLGGAQPEDPETEAYGPLGKFQWKLLVMAVGFVMLLGTPIAGIHFGASPGTWIKLLFVMCFGLAILSQLKFM